MSDLFSSHMNTCLHCGEIHISGDWLSCPVTAPNLDPVPSPEEAKILPPGASQGAGNGKSGRVERLKLWVPGIAAPQGSKNGYYNPKSGKVSQVESSTKVKPWREDIRRAILRDYHGPMIMGAVWVKLEFIMKRPVGTPKSRTPPAIKRPDLDKLERAILDAISSSGFWKDDSLVVRLVGDKRIAEIGEAPGVLITVQELLE